MHSQCQHIANFYIAIVEFRTDNRFIVCKTYPIPPSLIFSAARKMIHGEFDGVLKEGVRDGVGRLTWSNGDRYEGDFKNGLRHGTGTMFEQKGSRKYVGTWVLSQKEGKGVEIFANGDKYIGEYARDRFHGQGELYTKGGLYSGSFKDGLRDGFGVMQFKTNCRYEGYWAKGRMEGKGLYSWPDSRRYEGEWVNGERTGMGVFTQVNGEKYDGTFFRNKMHGAGWWKYTHGKVRPGEWKDNVLLRWTGPEQFEAQMKAKRLLKRG